MINKAKNNKFKQKLIRNFSIVAHIDHGKSTLADCLIEYTGTLSKSVIGEQFLDSLELEKKRGITIKLNYIRLKYIANDKQTYILNMIDTPGHVDFTYEVSRSLAACEGAVLVVDASQGIQAQTLSNVDLCLENNLEIIPIINKIDLPQSNIKKTKTEIENIIGLDCNNIPLISAKNNINIKSVLEAIIKNIPPPVYDPMDPFKALIFDSYYDSFKGVMIYIKIFSGPLKIGDEIYFINGNFHAKITNIYFKIQNLVKVKQVEAGEVAIISCNLKDLSTVNIGDTIVLKNNKDIKPLPGYKKVIHVVFSSFFPIKSDEYEKLHKTLKKIKLTDDSLIFDTESSQTLGFGFRCGFLGGLHLEVIRERIQIEYDLNIISAMPSVRYYVFTKQKEKLTITNPSRLPEKENIESMEEPFCNVNLIMPNEYYGAILQYSIEKRGVFKSQKIIDNNSKLLEISLPLSELIVDYFDKIKSLSKGYASLDYSISEYKQSDLVKLNILLNNVVVEPLSSIVARQFAYNRGKKICEMLKKNLPRHSFEVPIQAAISKKIIARETLKANRKDVTAKLYGGDVTRKKKLLEKQKKGKKRMKSFGKVSIPQDVFVKLSKLS